MHAYGKRILRSENNAPLFIMHKSNIMYAFYILDIILTACYDLSVRRSYPYGIINEVYTMIKAVTKQNEVIETFNGYNGFYAWLLCSDWAVVDMNKPLHEFKRDGGVVTLEPINNAYLQKLNIKHD